MVSVRERDVHLKRKNSKSTQTNRTLRDFLSVESLDFLAMINLTTFIIMSLA